MGVDAIPPNTGSSKTSSKTENSSELGSVANLKQQLALDLNGSSLKDGAVFKHLNNLSQVERKALGTSLQGGQESFAVLEIPPGKIFLVEARDNPPSRKGWMPEHIILLLYNQDREERDFISEKYNYNPAGSYGLDIEKGEYEDVKQELVIGEGDARISFQTKLRIDLSSPEIHKKLWAMYDLVRRVNIDTGLNPPITEINVSLHSRLIKNNPRGIKVNIDHKHHLNTLVHEMGHAVYNEKFRPEPAHLPTINHEWLKIYALSLGGKINELVDDSNYIDVGDNVGHPDHNPTELFASSFQAYYLHGDQFASNISDSDTSPEMKELGQRIFSDLKKRVFEGKTFLKHKEDPSIGYSAMEMSNNDMIRRFCFELEHGENESFAAGTILQIAEGLNLKNKKLIVAAATRVHQSKQHSLVLRKAVGLIKSSEYKHELYSFFSRQLETEKDVDFLLSKLDSLGLTKDLFSEPLKELLSDSSVSVNSRQAALMFITKAGLNDPDLLTEVVAHFEDTHEGVRRAAAKIIVALKIEDQLSWTQRLKLQFI
jgi:hypothetical protein